MRALFFNEGNLGTHVLGHARLDAALQAGLAGTPEIEGRFCGLTPLGRLGTALATRRLEPLSRARLDLKELRWHLVQSARARWALQAALKEWPADVVHLYTPAVALAIRGLMKRVPVVLAMDTTVKEWWAMPAWRPSQSYASLSIAPSRALERRVLQSAALVLARTAWVRSTVEEEAPSARVIEHHPGIDLGRFRPAPHRDRARARVLFVGSRFEQKGGEDLLESLAGLLGEAVDLDIVTPEPVRERPGVRVHRLGHEDPALLDLQQQADVMCLPTHGDTNPWAVVEAMACGTAVLASDVGGIPDLLDAGRAGVIVPHGEVRHLRQALLALLEDPRRRATLGAAARSRCETHYDAKRQFGVLVDHLHRAVSAHPATRG